MTRFYNALAVLAVVLTPVAMMASLGYTVYATVLEMTGLAWLALISGLATAAALEAVGVVAGETALWFHARRDRRWWTAAIILVLYVVAGLAMLRGTPLVFLPALAGAVYVLVGLRAQAQREMTAGEHLATEQRQDERAVAAEDREWRREQWRIQESNRTAVKLARVQAEHPAAASTVQAASLDVASSVQASANGHGPAASGSMYQCKQCASTFASIQALGGHVRAAHKEQV